VSIVDSYPHRSLGADSPGRLNRKGISILADYPVWVLERLWRALESHDRAWDDTRDPPVQLADVCACGCPTYSTPGYWLHLAGITAAILDEASKGTPRL
jgi:hypothetical protein